MKRKPLCVIVDDELTAIGRLEQLLGDLDLLQVEGTYTDPDRFLAEVGELQAEVIFLDMEMDIAGDQVARELQAKKVIFVSGHREKALEAFDVEAIDFVEKPIKMHRLKRAVDKALAGARVDMLVLRTDEAYRHEIPIERVFYIEPHTDEPRDKWIHLVDRATPVRAKNIKFSALLELSEGSDLVQVNKGCIVNHTYATKLLSKDEIELENGERSKQVNLSDAYKEAFLSAKPKFT